MYFVFITEKAFILLMSKWYVTVISESLMLMPSLVVQVTTVISGQVEDCKAIWRLCNNLASDSGYPQRSYLVTPILNAEPGSRGENYTRVHVKARNCIERAFG
ncbi:uncharacterized protein LOC123720946 isoform X2 [Papilio machaon]|uniref:uncharacterized protein LOC123720946 isoform X2 n=1 Tax=Papilio machaon TaxID=76193 RepID=UPI001E662C1C|nr:uncharacterized protein LOC123720946 isoform X2 [Papilio machaon]